MINKNVELSNREYILHDADKKLSQKEIVNYVKGYLLSNELKRLQKYDEYYQVKNTEITERVEDKYWRNKTPNNYVPTAYFNNVVDSMAGYMFSDVQYITNSTDFLEVLENNNTEIHDMNSGVRALAYNKAIELVYTVGDGVSAPDIRFTPIDPRQVILIHTKDIEPKIFCAIWITMASQPERDFNVDVIYNDLWEYYYIAQEDIFEREPAKPLFFDECPVVYYYADDMSNYSVYEKIIPYINALDYIVTGNANDIEALTDAILVLTKVLQKDDLAHLDELKAIMDVDKEERVEYLTKEMDPAFREYATKLIIQEIHKHSHVIDWYSPDTGLSGEISGKAMKTRLFDMNMYSKRIEMVYRVGAEKRVRLINNLLRILGAGEAEVEIEYNRTLPDEFVENAAALNMVTFLSDAYKMEYLGIDPDEEMERMEEQKNKNMERMMLNSPQENEEEFGEDASVE
jgi:SPP1 family phage portal protein